MKKVALYARVSTKDQTTENQVIRLKEYCRINNLDYDLFEETESTRKTRPVKAALMQRLRGGEYTSIIVFKLDRFARSTNELIMDVTELINKKIDFISISDNLDFTTASGKLHFQILSAFCEFERSLISERTFEGLNRAKAEGKTLGRPSGSKDKGKRSKSGYYLREERKKSSLVKQRAGTQ